MAKNKVLVTGGLGFIGSHTVVELIAAGFEVVIADNLSNSEAFILDRIEQISGQRPAFYPSDLCSLEAVRQLYAEHPDIQVAIHFAAYKAVGESVKFPLKYFQNNLVSLLNLLEVMEEVGAPHLVFSSSATVYGQPDELPAREDTPFKKALSAYGSTKQMGEEILEKVAGAGKLKTIALRYFNPVGAHPSALIGELPRGVPNNLMPFLTQAVIGKRGELVVFGNDYNTPDGTAVRDYIHVVDLGKAHVKACEHLLEGRGKEAFEVFNIGTGRGNSVLEVIQAFEKINGVKVPYSIGPRREGDAEQNYADATKANTELGWNAELDLEDMVRDAWRWEQAIGGK
ncbi:UDP-glucose 4-epimerase GalE [Paraflavisolibacter sp. H34]|uniref:UDP-glucose 4-epimerase GalE n=1 Tax=Huijunlia imazamoxiresistens TaxID=3127457 RepID=UPI00301ADEF8